MTIYFSSRSGGPCWTRERGYHQLDPWPDHIKRIVMASRKPKKKAKAMLAASSGDSQT